MRIIVTGVRGFIGSVFCARAVEAGHEIWGLDDESRGLNATRTVLGDHYIVHDCRKGFKQPLADRGIVAADAVVHLAAATGSLERPLVELRELNVDMTKYVYQDALSFGAKAFAWPTTSLAIAVPDSPYVQSKEEALAMLREVDALARISTPVRFFNVAGAYTSFVASATNKLDPTSVKFSFTECRKNEVHILPTLVNCVLGKRPFTINGADYATVDGTPSRDYVNVRNVADYLLALIDRKLHSQPIMFHPRDGAVWTGTGVSLTVNQVLAETRSLLGHVDVRIGPRRLFDCGALITDPQQTEQLTVTLGSLIHPMHSVRQEVRVLVETRPKALVP